MAAISRVGSRSAATLLNLSPPDEVDILRESPRLQSMVEAYDLLRGSGVSGADDAALRARIDNWAQALHDDLNATGVAGVGGHRDHWGIKAGASLITAALALSSHPHAAGWMAFGNLLVHDSLAITGSSAGWYRESAHYLNYSLDNLYSTAFQVQKRAGVDWFTALSPFAQAALDLRQPDGSEADFEEGVPAVFPFDVFAPRYPELGGQLAWAWNHSSKNTDSWQNQQLAAATQFLAGELPGEVQPWGRPSRFVEGDAHISALRTGWGAQAVQATLFAARDYQASTLVASRHDMQNPLDLVVAALGQPILPTSGGGPTVTTSSDRSYYLTPASKNVPLVNGTAPFVTDGAQLSVDSRLAGQDQGGQAGRYLELVRAKVSGAYAAPVSSVSRTVALIGGGLAAAPAGTAIDVDGLATDASFSALRENGGGVLALGLVAATAALWKGTPLFASDHPLTLSATWSAAGLLAELSQDQTGASTFTLWPGAPLEAGAGVRAFFNQQANQQALAAGTFAPGAAGFTFTALAGGGTLRVERGGHLLDAVPPETIDEGTTLNLTLLATPQPGSRVQFSMIPPASLPAGEAPALDLGTGAFRWTPSFAVAPRGQARDLIFTFVAESDGFVASQPCAIRVNDVNRPPRFTTLAGVALADPGSAQAAATAGTALSLVVEAGDEDGDGLSLSAPALPAGASFQQLLPPGPDQHGQASGQLSWTPSAAGDATATLRVTDLAGASDALVIGLHVAAGTSAAHGCASVEAGATAAGLLLLWRTRRRSVQRR